MNKKRRKRREKGKAIEKSEGQNRKQEGSKKQGFIKSHPIP